MRKINLFFISLLILCGVFVSCSDGGSDDENLVTKYSYHLNENIIISGTTQKYHRVNEFHCVDNDDSTYNVKECVFHYFAVSNSVYTNLTGPQLCSIAKNKSRNPDAKKTQTLSKNVTYTATDSSSGKKYYYYLPTSLKYEVWWYY